METSVGFYHKKMKFTGFGGYCAGESMVIRPERFKEIIHAVTNSTSRPILARGSGCSYGDAALNNEGAMLLTNRMNKLLYFNDETGVLRVEAGVKLKDILSLFGPRGWILPVVPGSSDITIGGCIAFDVHSKNHWKEGGFHRHVTEIRLVLADGSIHDCSPQKEPDLFWATVGGMGLTGIIVEITLKLRRVNAPYVKAHSIPFRGLEDLLSSLSQACKVHDFAVAWIDLLNLNIFGRGILFVANHVTASEIPELNFKKDVSFEDKTLSLVPLKPLAPFFNTATNRMFNLFFYNKHVKKSLQPHFVGLRPFLFPWDNIPHWNQLYGRKGFVEYQCVLPFEGAVSGIAAIMEYVRAHNAAYPVYFAVIKRMGASFAPMSFPLDGYSFLMDFPVRDGIWRFLEKIDQIVASYGGRIFLAKDGRLDAAIFRKMYPQVSGWLKVKRAVDPNGLFSSNMSRRLRLM